MERPWLYNRKLEILLIDRNLPFLCAASRQLESAGISCSIARTGKDAQSVFSMADFDMVVSNLDLADIYASKLLDQLSKLKPYPFGVVFAPQHDIDALSKQYPRIFIVGKPQRIVDMSRVVKAAILKKIHSPSSPCFQEVTNSHECAA